MGKLRDRRLRSSMTRNVKIAYVSSDNTVIAASQIEPSNGNSKKQVRIDLLGGYIEDLYEMGRKCELLVNFETKTLTKDDDVNVSFTREFKMVEDQPLPIVGNENIFRNIIIDNELVLNVNLVEKDSGLKEKIESINNPLSELRNGIDLAGDIPYLKLISKISNFVFSVFGKKHDDPVWDGKTSFLLKKQAGCSTLSSGIYIFYEAQNIEDGESIEPSALVYDSSNNTVKVDDKNIQMSNYFIFSISLDDA